MPVLSGGLGATIVEAGRIQPPETKTSGVDTAPEELATQPNSSK